MNSECGTEPLCRCDCEHSGTALRPTATFRIQNRNCSATCVVIKHLMTLHTCECDGHSAVFLMHPPPSSRFEQPQNHLMSAVVPVCPRVRFCIWLSASGAPPYYIGCHNSFCQQGRICNHWRSLIHSNYMRGHCVQMLLTDCTQVSSLFNIIPAHADKHVTSWHALKLASR